MVEKIEESEAVRMSCWTLCMGGWVGGWKDEKRDLFISPPTLGVHIKLVVVGLPC